MDQFEKDFEEWLKKQNVDYLRDLYGRLCCIHDSADALSLLEIKMAIGAIFGR
jgi:hypothetical protein